jgi:hypothetical protein
MEALCFSETLVSTISPEGVITQRINADVFTTARTSNITGKIMVEDMK